MADGSSKSDKGSSISTSDMNVTREVKTQGPLSETLKGYDRWDVNIIKDPVKDGDRSMKGRGTKP